MKEKIKKIVTGLFLVSCIIFVLFFYQKLTKDNNNNSNKSILDRVINEWSERVAGVRCVWLSPNTNKIIHQSYGSGLAFDYSAKSSLGDYDYYGLGVYTNKSILVFQNVLVADKCFITIYKNKATYEVPKEYNEPIRSLGFGYHGITFHENDDYGIVGRPLLLDEEAPHFEFGYDSVRGTINNCMTKSIEPSEQIVILTYSAIDSQYSLVVSEGVITSDDGNYYLTSVKQEKENTGGAAILVKDNCFIGIPDLSLGRILKWQTWALPSDN